MSLLPCSQLGFVLNAIRRWAFPGSSSTIADVERVSTHCEPGKGICDGAIMSIIYLPVPLPPFFPKPAQLKSFKRSLGAMRLVVHRNAQNKTYVPDRKFPAWKATCPVLRDSLSTGLVFLCWIPSIGSSSESPNSEFEDVVLCCTHCIRDPRLLDRVFGGIEFGGLVLF